jgi:hypothetical protein
VPIENSSDLAHFKSLYGVIPLSQTGASGASGKLLVNRFLCLKVQKANGPVQTVSPPMAVPEMIAIPEND